MKIFVVKPWIELGALSLCLGALAAGCDGSKGAVAPSREAGVLGDARDGDARGVEVSVLDAAGMDLDRPDTTGADTTVDLTRLDTQGLDTQGSDTQNLDTAQSDGSDPDRGTVDASCLDSGVDKRVDDLPAADPDAGDAFASIEAGVDQPDGMIDPAACPGTGGPGMVRQSGGYCIDRTEVTRGQYEAWLVTNPTTAGQDPRCSWNKTFTPPAWCAAVACQGADCGSHPQACVDWCDAFAYCKAVGKRLCGARAGGPVGFGDGYADANQSQWYNACTSGGVLAFPYGDSYDKARCNGSDFGLAMTVPTGSLTGCQSPEASNGGVFDLSGNVDEWEDACDGSTGAADNCRLRGGSYDTYYLGMDCNQDFSLRRDLITQTQGIRCCSP